MIVYRRGYISQPMLINDVLRAQWEDTAEQILDEIESREKAGIPLDDLSPLPPFRRRESVGGLRARIKVLSQAEVAAYQMDVAAAAEVEDAKEQDALLRAAYRAFVSEAVVEFDGFEDEDGSAVRLTVEEALPVIEDAGALPHVAGACAAYQGLSGAKKKRLHTSGVLT